MKNAQLLLYFMVTECFLLKSKTRQRSSPSTFLLNILLEALITAIRQKKKRKEKKVYPTWKGRNITEDRRILYIGNPKE